MIIYQNDYITIKKKNVFGKIGLSGYNSKNNATITAFAKNEAEINEKIKYIINELKKDNSVINLTEKLTKIENNFLKTVFNHE